MSGMEKAFTQPRCGYRPDGASRGLPGDAEAPRAVKAARHTNMASTTPGSSVDPRSRRPQRLRIYGSASPTGVTHIEHTAYASPPQWGRWVQKMRSSVRRNRPVDVIVLSIFIQQVGALQQGLQGAEWPSRYWAC